MAVTATAQHIDDSPRVRIDRVELRRTRKLNGLTYADLARLADISFGYVGLIERGERTSVSPPVFVRLCDALGVQDRTKLLAKDEGALSASEARGRSARAGRNS